jgi:DNA-binding protein YbaB
MSMPDDARESETTDYIAELREKTRLSAEKMAQVRGTATSHDRSITVEVNATGQLTNLVLTDQALALGAARLAQQIRATAVAAIQNTAQARAEALADLTANPAVSERLGQFRSFVPPLPDPDGGHETGESDEDSLWDTGKERFAQHHRDDEG